MKSRDKLYIVAMISAAIFAAFTVAIVIGFKQNEAFFDSHSHIGMLAEKEIQDMLAQKEKNDYIYQFMKKNVEIEIIDKPEKQLWIPLENSIQSENIEILHEFTKNKFIIKLKNSRGGIAKNAQVISDSSIMDAVGVYNLKDDIAVEIYCDQTTYFDCECKVENTGLRITFVPLREIYENIAVVYIPYEKRDMLASTATFDYKKNKVFFCSQLQEEYTQNEVVEFANKVYADLLIGVDVKEVSTNQNLTVIYNDDYFIPEYGSIELASDLASQITKNFDIELLGYSKSQENDVIVKNAKVPAAFAVLSVIKDDNNSLEIDYKLKHGMISAIDAIIIERMDIKNNIMSK